MTTKFRSLFLIPLIFFAACKKDGPVNESVPFQVPATADIVMYEEEFQLIKQLLESLRMDASAKIVFLVDKNGQQIAGAGEIDLVMQYREEDRETLDQLQNVAVHTGGATLPLGALADFRFVAGPRSIERENHQSKVSVSANATSTSAGVRTCSTTLPGR